MTSITKHIELTAEQKAICHEIWSRSNISSRTCMELAMLEGIRIGMNHIADAGKVVEPRTRLTDEQIDRIADNLVKAMPDGIRGFCATWGWQQFARELLDVCKNDERAAPQQPAEPNMLQWAVEQWQDQVMHRPLENVWRRTLDYNWRMVIRRCGGDDLALVGPIHDDLVAAAPEPRNDL